MIQPGRKYSASSQYRYGFNGKELDNEVIQYDYGFRIYDPRVGRFKSLDPLQKKYPFYTPYQFASNSPILSRDIDGLESDKNTNYTESTPLPENLQGGALYQHELKYDKATSFGIGMLKTIFYGIGALTEIPARMHFNIRPENEAGTFPLTHGQNFRDWTTAPFTAPIYAVNNIRNSPNNPEVWGANLVVIIPYAKPFLKVGNSVVALDVAVENVASVQVYIKANEIISSTSKSALPRAVSAIYDKQSGQTYFGTSQGLNEKSILHPQLIDLMPAKSMEKWPVMNCAECDALNNALNGGAKIENLQIHTVKINKASGTVEDFNTCTNCKVTTKNIEVTSDDN